MDPNRFEGLVRALAQPASRRTLAALLGILGGPLLRLLPDEATDARSRRGHGHDGGAVHNERKKKKRRKCKGDTTKCGKTCVDTTTDAANCGRCGQVCIAPNTCGGGGAPGACGCTKTTCTSGQCGAISDGCGGTLNCGDDCDFPETCGGGGAPNVCGCLPNGAVTTDLTCGACCSRDCCFEGVEGQRVCAGGCG